MNSNRPRKVLFDAGCRIHSGILTGAVFDQEIKWGDIEQTIPITGYTRKSSQISLDQQMEIDALYTIGRLIREGRIEAYTSHEIDLELMRGRVPVRELNAFRDCKFKTCSSPLERSNFRSTIDFSEYISKGGKKDKNKGYTDFTQIAFLEWLLTLESKHTDSFIKHQAELKLTDFEIESLRALDWLKILAMKLRSSENFPDVFHIWTAQRNNMDVFLTLDKRLTNSIASVVNNVK